MKLYHLACKENEEPDYEETLGAVVAADNAGQARANLYDWICTTHEVDRGDMAAKRWLDANKTKATQIGTAKYSLSAGVVLESNRGAR